VWLWVGLVLVGAACDENLGQSAASGDPAGGREANVSGRVAKPIEYDCPERASPELTASDQTILRASTDAAELMCTAIAFAASPSAEAHATLGRELVSADFLARLDADDAYAGVYADLRLNAVLSAMMVNRRASVDAALLGLLASDVFQSQVLRMQLTIRALAVIRPAPAPAVEYWARLLNPQSPLAYDVVEALTVNQTPPALTLLEERLVDPAFDSHQKLGWLRQIVLPRRNDEPLLGLCERVVMRSGMDDVRVGVVEALFDYRPEEWYIDSTAPQPPARADASPAARATLRRIGDYAIGRLSLSRPLRASVSAALAELR
jgi:hypothetical protein